MCIFVCVCVCVSEEISVYAYVQVYIQYADAKERAYVYTLPVCANQYGIHISTHIEEAKTH